MGNNSLYVRLVEWFDVDEYAARDFISTLPFNRYNELLEATVDRNPALMSGTNGFSDIDDIEALMKKPVQTPQQKVVQQQQAGFGGNEVPKYEPSYIPSYIKNNNGGIDYAKVTKGDRIAYVDDFGRMNYGVVVNKTGAGYSIKTSRGTSDGIEQGRLRTPRELSKRYADSGHRSAKAKGAAYVTKKINDTTSAVDKLNTLTNTTESLDIEEAAPAVKMASAPSIIGDIDKRPSTTLQVRARMDRDNAKKRSKRKRGFDVK